jgi:hypothetical protein
MEQILENPMDGVRAGTLTGTGKSVASWPAIIAGAFVAVAASLILLSLGSGLGFASVSPWADHGVSATTFTVTMAIWLVVTQWISAALGGYIAGRLRTRWVGTHVHEVFFRDTAHGLITWAVATVLVATVVASTVVSAVGGGMHAAADATASGVAGAATTESKVGSMGNPVSAYGLDTLFRSPTAGSGDQGSSDPRLEAAHIAANAVATGSVSDADRTYLSSLVAARTGASQQDAQKRVDDFIAGVTQAEAKVKAAADTARKAAAQASLYTALSLLVGAFIASVSAALGGRLRDEHI